MDSESLGKIKERIKKLLALSASPVEAEAALAMEKCQYLMERYGIRTVDVDPVLNRMKVHSNIVDGSTGDNWEKLLAIHIASALDAVPIVIRTPKSRAWQINFIGGATDIDLVISLFKTIRRTIVMLSNAYVANIQEHKRTAKLCYCSGAAEAVRKNLVKIYKPVPSTTDLVVVKKTEIEKAISEMYGKINSKTVKNNYNDRAAFSQGFADGSEIGVHTGILSNEVAA